MCALVAKSDAIENFVCQFYLLLNITVGLFAIFHMSINVYLMKLLHSELLQYLFPARYDRGLLASVCLCVRVLFYIMWLVAAIVYSLLLRTQAFSTPPPLHYNLTNLLNYIFGHFHCLIH